MNICIIDPVMSIPEYIKEASTYGNNLLKLPLMEDINIIAETDLSSLRDQNNFINTFASTVETFTGVSSMLSGTTSFSATNLLSKMNAPMWRNGATKPIEIQMKLGFFSEVQQEKPLGLNFSQFNSASQTGHWIHALNRLIGYSTLSVDVSGESFSVPGVHMRDMKEISAAVMSADPALNKSAEVEVNLTSKSKLVSVLIPGIIWLKIAVVPRVSITYSKHITNLGYPLWATADVTFLGVMPAMKENFIHGAQMGKNIVGNSILGLDASFIKSKLA